MSRGSAGSEASGTDLGSCCCGIPYAAGTSTTQDGFLRFPEVLWRHRRTLAWAGLLVVSLGLVLVALRSSPSVLQSVGQAVPSRGSQHWILRWLDSYGLPLAFGAILIGGTGVPVPANLLVLALGASAAEGRQSAAWVFFVVFIALVVGDVLGYFVGSWGGRLLIRRMAHFLGWDEQVPRAREAVQRRGWIAVFLTRWLLSPLCIPCNWVCGSMGYPLQRFIVAGALGEGLFVGIYLLLGMAFSEQIERIAELVGSAGLWLVGIAVAGFLIWRVCLASMDRVPI